MARYATYIRASTDTQETVHQRDAINDWLDHHDVARDMPNLTRQGLMKIHKDHDRRQWYLRAEADDERIDTALDTVQQAQQNNGKWI